MDEQHANETLLQRTRKSENFYPCCPFTFDPPNDDIDVIFGLIITGNYPMDVRVLVQPFYASRSATNKEIPINLAPNSKNLSCPIPKLNPEIKLHGIS